MITKGFTLLGKQTAFESNNKVSFVFEKRPGLEEAAEKFLSGRGGKVEVNSLLEAQKRLKNLLFENSVKENSYAPF